MDWQGAGLMLEHLVRYRGQCWGLVITTMVVYALSVIHPGHENAQLPWAGIQATFVPVVHQRLVLLAMGTGAAQFAVSLNLLTEARDSVFSPW